MGNQVPMQRLSDLLDASRGDVIALVGAGGKTSVMMRMARELGGRFRVLCTTTTHMASTETLPSTIRAGAGADPVSIERACQSAWACGEACLVTGLESGDGRVAGPPGDILARLSRAAEITLVEADGSRRKPLKSPAGHEPNLPPSANKAVLVFGADAFDLPACEGNFFNLDAANRSGAVRDGEIVSPEVFGRIVSRGGYLALASRMPLYLIVNKADACGDGRAEEFARAAYSPLVRRIVVSSVSGPDAYAREVSNASDVVACGVLAAGESRRFGAAKLSSPFRGTTLLGAALEGMLAAGFDRMMLVVGHEAGSILGSLDERLLRGVEVVQNPDYKSGMGSSIGAAACAARECDALAIALGDKPAAGPEAARAVLGAYRRSAAAACAAVSLGTPGHPAIFRKELFQDLRGIRGDSGAREILRRNASRAVFVEVDPASQLDVDEPRDIAS